MAAQAIAQSLKVNVNANELYNQVGQMTGDSVLVLNVSGNGVHFKCCNGDDGLMWIPACTPYAADDGYISLLKGMGTSSKCKTYPSDTDYSTRQICEPGTFYLYHGKGKFTLAGSEAQVLAKGR